MGQLQQQAICVLGMHRSGTSAIARALNLLGAYIGPPEKLLPPQEDNPEGFWEHEAIVDFHVRLLRALNHDWHSIQPLPERWWERPEVAPYRQELTALIHKEFASERLWMWKDPRTCLFLPLWTGALRQLNIEPYYVICLRHPLDVAASLQRRDGLSRERSLALWQLYTLSSLHWTHNARRRVMSYDRLLDNWEPCLRNLVKAMDVGWPASVAAQRAALRQFLQPQLCHSHSDMDALSSAGEVGELVERTYRLLLEAERTASVLQSKKFVHQVEEAYGNYGGYAGVFGRFAEATTQVHTGRAVLEVFWLAGGEFSPQASSATDVFIDGQEHSYECRLPLPQGGMLRLDVVNFPATITIRSMELCVLAPDATTSSEVCSWTIENGFPDIVVGPDMTLLRDRAEGLVCVSSSGDPQLLLHNIPNLSNGDSQATALLRVVMTVKQVMTQPLVDALVQWRDQQQQAAAATVQAALDMRDGQIEMKDRHIENLERAQQEQTATIAKLQQTTAELQRTTAVLDAQRQLQQREIEDLREQTTALAQQYQQEARLRSSMLQSLSWQITSPLRVARAWAKSAWRLVRWRRPHIIKLEPLHDVTVEGHGFRSTGTDPQFLFHSSRGRMPTGWTLFSYVTTYTDRRLTPYLYVDGGNGFLEAQKVLLRRPVHVAITPVTESETADVNATDAAARTTEIRASFLIQLPDAVQALRFDPLSTSGPFVLKDVTLREVGWLQVVAMLLWRHGRPVLFRPQQLLGMIQQSRNVAQIEGQETLWRRFFLQESGHVAGYQEWVEAYDTLIEEDLIAMRQQSEGLPHKPLISVLMPVYNPPETWLRLAIESVRRQTYPYWELCIADDASPGGHVKPILEEYRAKDPRIKVLYRSTNGHISAASNSALTLATGEVVALLDHDDELPPHALYLVARELNAHPDAAIIYSDEDKIDETGRRYGPYFKPDWNPALFLTQNCISHLGVYRTALMREVGGFRAGYEGSQDWDLALRIVERVSGEQIRHIPHILYHWRAITGSTALAIDQKNYASDAQIRLLQSHFERCGMTVQILPATGSHWRIKYPLPTPAPLVSMIIPTRDRSDLLRRFLDSLWKRTTYPHYELIVVDNESTDPQTLEYLDQLVAQNKIRLLRYAAPFNYSAINNLAVRHANGELLAFLNNDLEVITHEWLEEMVSHAVRPDIGAVGALLYYPDNTIQHAGVILGLRGVAGHAYDHKPRGHSGQMGRALLLQNLSAVTAACLVMRRSIFDEVGGFDDNLSIAFNDVDLCLRIRQAGFRNLWTPYAELYHHESATRGQDDTVEKQIRFRQEVDYMLKRWGEVLPRDPALNPNLTLDRADFSLAFPPRTTKPWQQ
jgi:O-antigen biosynthesis protein